MLITWPNLYFKKLQLNNFILYICLIVRYSESFVVLISTYFLFRQMMADFRRNQMVILPLATPEPSLWVFDSRLISEKHERVWFWSILDLHEWLKGVRATEYWAGKLGSKGERIKRKEERKKRKKSWISQPETNLKAPQELCKIF